MITMIFGDGYSKFTDISQVPIKNDSPLSVHKTFPYREIYSVVKQKNKYLQILE